MPLEGVPGAPAGVNRGAPRRDARRAGAVDRSLGASPGALAAADPPGTEPAIGSVRPHVARPSLDAAKRLRGVRRAGRPAPRRTRVRVARLDRTVTMTTYGRGRGRGPRGEHRHRAALGPSPRPRSGKTGAAERPPPPRRSSRSIELDAQWFVVASTDPYPGPVGLVALLPERADQQTGIRLPQRTARCTEVAPVSWTPILERNYGGWWWLRRSSLRLRPRQQNLWVSFGSGRSPSA